MVEKENDSFPLRSPEEIPFDLPPGPPSDMVAPFNVLIIYRALRKKLKERRKRKEKSK